jgi:O-antigen/teichoic acid export membrane protein
MGAAGLDPFGALLIMGPTIFSIGFGGRWLQAGIIAQRIAPLLLLRFMSSPTSTLYWKLNMQREQWFFSVAAACYRTLCYSLTAFGFGLNFVILLHVAIESVAILLFNLFTLKRLRDLQHMRLEGAT